MMDSDTFAKVVLTVLVTATAAAIATWAIMRDHYAEQRHPYNIDKPWVMICQELDEPVGDPEHKKWMCNT